MLPSITIRRNTVSYYQMLPKRDEKYQSMFRLVDIKSLYKKNGDIKNIHGEAMSFTKRHETASKLNKTIGKQSLKEGLFLFWPGR